MNIKSNIDILSGQISSIFSSISVYPDQEVYIFDRDECIALIESNYKNRDYTASAIYHDEMVVGLVVYSWESHSYKNVCIDNFFIDKEFQGRGIGKTAFSETIVNIYEQNFECGNIGLFVHKNNKVAISLFSDCGFVTGKEINSLSEQNMQLESICRPTFTHNRQLKMVHYKVTVEDTLNLIRLRRVA